MRLLNVNNFETRVFHDEETTPPYVIASHRWFMDNEITYQDLLEGRNLETRGFEKVQGFALYVRNHYPDVDWLWIDTCCIDKKDSAELSESIISMFKWYRNSAVCLAYLHDVDANPMFHPISLQASEWFKRGWTLQELLAPRLVIFLAHDWTVIGFKGDEKTNPGDSTGVLVPSIVSDLHQITGIPKGVLRDYEQSKSLSIDQKLVWAVNRETSRKEDIAYCLFGIFEVYIPVLYGEGSESAKKRLRHAIAAGKRITGLLPTGQHEQPSQSSRPTLECPTCPRRFQLKINLDQHSRDSHGIVFPFDCQKCKRTFKSDEARDQHIRDSHSALLASPAAIQLHGTETQHVPTFQLQRTKTYGVKLDSPTTESVQVGLEQRNAILIPVHSFR